VGSIWTPELRLQSQGDACRLSLVGVTYGNGATLQEAGNDLLTRLFDLGLAVREGRLRFSSDSGRPDQRVMDYLWEIGDLAVRGGDLRDRVFGVPEQRSASD
jgi:hypothetical protein